MTRPIFLTGATGFLGMEVLVRLLERGDREVVALVRGADRPAAEERLEGTLAKLWRDPSPYRDRVRAVPGDLTSPGLGLDVADRGRIAAECGTVLHCAASISFDLPIDEARQINVEGTRSVIELAREIQDLDRFLHVSTAFVSGENPGTFGESDLDVGQTFRNTYEQTKNESEQLIADAADLSPVVVRPSIVMGESDSGWTPAFNVLYWPLRAFSRGLFDRVPALAHGRVDVVPVDYVADGIVHLLDRDDTGVFNLVGGRDAPRVDDLLEMGHKRFGRDRPELVDVGEPTALADGAVYVPYFDMELEFDDSRARSVLGAAGITCPRLEDYFSRLIDYAEAAKWGKIAITREEAREQFAGVPA